MRKFDLSFRSSRSSYFATCRNQLTILSKTDAFDEEKWPNMRGTFVKAWFTYESHFVRGRDSLVDILKFFFFLAEDGIRDRNVTGVQTCALPISDPAAILSVVGRLGVPRSLTTLVEAESLFNDGTGIVIFVLALQALDTGLDGGQIVVGLVEIGRASCRARVPRGEGLVSVWQRIG